MIVTRKYDIILITIYYFNKYEISYVSNIVGFFSFPLNLGGHEIMGPEVNSLHPPHLFFLSLQPNKRNDFFFFFFLSFLSLSFCRSKHSVNIVLPCCYIDMTTQPLFMLLDLNHQQDWKALCDYLKLSRIKFLMSK